MKPDEVAVRIGWIKEIAARLGKSLSNFVISHRVYIGFADKWTETGGYVQGIMAPPRELAEYLSQFGTLGVSQILITPIGADPSLDQFLDRFDAQVRPYVSAR